MNENNNIIHKLSIYFNTFLWIFLFSMIGITYYYHVKLLMLVSINNFIFTNLTYILIAKKRYHIATVMMFLETIVFLAAGTVSLGMGYGFYLYGVSMVTVLFYVNYIAGKVKTGKINETLILGLTIASHLFSTVYAITNGPLYVINDIVALAFFVTNSLIVLSILIVYLKIHVNTITETENKLEEMALKDKLTELYNRHYLISYMEAIANGGLKNSWIAILDLDDFKKINDAYGHNCGDYVLKTIASIIKNKFPECTVCRWGGEEFIILGSMDKTPNTSLDDLRQLIADTDIEFENTHVKATVTIGTEKYSEGMTTDQWISRADKKLYEGKTSGKNKVVGIA